METWWTRVNIPPSPEAGGVCANPSRRGGFLSMRDEDSSHPKRYREKVPDTI